MIFTIQKHQNNVLTQLNITPTFQCSKMFNKSIHKISLGNDLVYQLEEIW
jgi:hypothetical protein